MATLRERFDLDKNKIIKKTIASLAILIFLAIIFSPVLLTICMPALILIIPLGAFAYWYQLQYYKNYHYDLNDNGLEIRKGVFWSNTITVPNEKISDIYVDQDILDRYFGLYDLHFSSASASSGRLSHIDGLNKENLEGLRQFLLDKFGEGSDTTTKETSLSLRTKSSQTKNHSKTEHAFKPDKKGLYAQLIGGFFGGSLFFAWIGIQILIIFPPLLIFILPMFLFSFYMIKKDFEALEYEIRSDGVWMRRSWLTPKESLIFYKNIQDTEVSQDFLEQILGLNHINIKSMSYDSSTNLVVSFLSAEDSKRFQDLLSEKIKTAQKRQAERTHQEIDEKELEPEDETTLEKNPYKNNFMLGFALQTLYTASILSILTVVFTAGIAILFIIPIIFIVAAGAAFNALIEQSTYSYAFGKGRLVIERGLFSKQKKNTPYYKIQDIKLSMGTMEHFIGQLIHIYAETGSRDITPTKSSRRGAARLAGGLTLVERIPFLNKDDAAKVMDTLLTKMHLKYPQTQPALRGEFPLSAKKPLKKTIAFFYYPIHFILIAFLVSIALFLAPSPLNTLATIAFGLTIAGTIILAIGAAILYRYEKQYMRKYFYNADDDSLVIRKGVFGFEKIIIPFKNIQTVYIDQDMFDVYFDLYDVYVTTVTQQSGHMSHIDGLKRDDAQKVAKLIFERVEAARHKGRKKKSPPFKEPKYFEDGSYRFRDKVTD